LNHPVPYVFDLSKRLICESGAQLFSILSYLHDLISLKSSLTDLHLQTSFKSLDLFNFQSLDLILNTVDLLFHFFEPMIDGGFKLSRVSGKGGDALQTGRRFGMEFLKLEIEMLLEG